jgi:hypothetical protein
MTPEHVRERAPLVLDQRARERYLEDGFATLPADKAVDLYGPAGTVLPLHCRVVHGSAINHSSRMRPLFLNVYSAADH